MLLQRHSPMSSIPSANWENTLINESLEPTLNNVDNESMATQEKER